MAAYPAVQLFVQCAARIRPDFELTPGNAARRGAHLPLTEGLPLAIELAASWARTLRRTRSRASWRAGLASLASTAYDVPERHRSLAAVFEHSWARLLPREQVILAQLAVFRGGFDRAAAEAVVGEVAPPAPRPFAGSGQAPGGPP